MHDGTGHDAAGDSLAQGTPPGSLRHFAVLYSGSHATDSLVALYAFEKEIADTVRALDHEVAHTRLQWWRSEIDRLLTGQALHPIGRALQSLPGPVPGDRRLLHECLVAADIDLSRMTLTNRSELDAYCFRASGSLQTLAAQACAGNRALADNERRFARELGAVVRQAELLRDMRYDVTQGRLRVPLERLEAAGMDPSAVRPDTAAAPFLDVLHEWRDEVRTRLLALPSMLSPLERAAQRHGMILAALYVNLVERIEHRGELSRTRAEVPPWRRLWTAWRTATRCR
jgi:15-cis-phytoene synthase